MTAIQRAEARAKAAAAEAEVSFRDNSSRELASMAADTIAMPLYAGEGQSAERGEGKSEGRCSSKGQSRGAIPRHFEADHPPLSNGSELNFCNASSDLPLGGGRGSQGGSRSASKSRG